MFLEVQCEVSTVSDDLGAMSSAGAGPLYFFTLYGDADFFFHQELFSSNPMCNLWDIFKRKMRYSGSNNTEELKAQ